MREEKKAARPRGPGLFKASYLLASSGLVTTQRLLWAMIVGIYGGDVCSLWWRGTGVSLAPRRVRPLPCTEKEFRTRRINNAYILDHVVADKQCRAKKSDVSF